MVIQPEAGALAWSDDLTMGAPPPALAGESAGCLSACGVTPAGTAVLQAPGRFVLTMGHVMACLSLIYGDWRDCMERR
jgi:hypothetical protein